MRAISGCMTDEKGCLTVCHCSGRCVALYLGLLWVKVQLLKGGAQGRIVSIGGAATRPTSIRRGRRWGPVMRLRLRLRLWERHQFRRSLLPSVSHCDRWYTGNRLHGMEGSRDSVASWYCYDVLFGCDILIFHVAMTK